MGYLLSFAEFDRVAESLESLRVLLWPEEVAGGVFDPLSS